MGYVLIRLRIGSNAACIDFDREIAGLLSEESQLVSVGVGLGRKL
jgi:hypothetical protein